MTTSKNDKNQEESVAIGVMSIVCSIASYAVLGIFLAPAGVILGCIALSKGSTNRALGIVGIVAGGIALAMLFFSLAALTAVTSRYK